MSKKTWKTIGIIVLVILAFGLGAWYIASNLLPLY